MSCKGNSHHTAAVERFFKTIKVELICRCPWGHKRIGNHIDVVDLPID